MLERRIVAVSLGHNVLSRFTAFVAVDRSTVVNPGGGRTQVVQPVEYPAGWEESAVTSFACRLAACDMQLAPPAGGAIYDMGPIADRRKAGPAKPDVGNIRRPRRF